MHCIRNNFIVPQSSVGRAFVSKLARLFYSVSEGSVLKSIALKAIFVVCAFVLQKCVTETILQFQGEGSCLPFGMSAEIMEGWSSG